MVKTNTPKFCAEAIATLVVSRYLCLEGVKVLKRPSPRESEGNETMLLLLRDLEAQLYFLCASAYMCSAFGRKGKVRRIADKCLKDILQQAIKEV